MVIVFAALIVAITFVAALAGILSRLPHTWAVFWPANALLLGVLARWRGPALVTAVPAAFVGYMLADLVTGSDLLVSALLAACNLAGVTGGLALIQRLPDDDRQLRTAAAAARIALVAVLASTVGAIGGAFAAVVVFGDSPVNGFMDWFVIEFVNYMVLLPLVLSFPVQGFIDLAKGSGAGRRQRMRLGWLLRRVAGPALLLVALLVAAGFGRGGGAIAFTIPALIAAALLTNVFVTTLFVLVSTVGMLALAISAGPGPAPAPVNLSTTFGLALLAIGPLVVAAAMVERRAVLDALRDAFARDDLTGTLRRGEFLKRADAVLNGDGDRGRSAVLLMMDLDHFKHLNDSQGHQAGDRALVAFADIVASTLADRDLFGRLGGEEFAVLMPEADLVRAVRVAEHICLTQCRTAKTMFGVDGPTVSIGVALSDDTVELPHLLARADTAVYRAKRNERNQVVVADSADERCGTTTPEPQPTTAR